MTKTQKLLRKLEIDLKLGLHDTKSCPEIPDSFYILKKFLLRPIKPGKKNKI